MVLPADSTELAQLEERLDELYQQLYLAEARLELAQSHRNIFSKSDIQQLEDSVQAIRENIFTLSEE